ncbi:MAG: clpp3 [Chlamydiales bacterium]|nr:clpp3 [Chlamydiales bacterium]
MIKLQDKIDQSLIDARRIFVAEGIDSDSAEDAIKKLWYLDLVEPGKPILLVIHSPGGSIDSGFAIWDQVKMIRSPVVTLVTGLAASMGSVLSLVADKGSRLATPNARIMIHQPSLSGMFKGQATDLDIQAREILKTRGNLVRLYSEATGKDIETVDKALDRDNWMSAQEALEFGLIDRIVETFEDLKEYGF